MLRAKPAKFSALATVRLFGPLEIEIDGRVLGPRAFGGIKPKQILEILLTERGRAVSKERLSDLLWGDEPPRNVSGTLETYVSLLRKHLGGLVQTTPGAYVVPIEAVDVDLDRFDALRAQGGRTALEAALALVRGEVLEDEPHGTWALRLREQYRSRYERTLVDAAEASLDSAEPAEALSHAERAIALDRASERAHRVIMRAHHALGRPDEALAAYQRCRTALGEELGVEPQTETDALRDAIRRREPSAKAPRVLANGRSRVLDVPLLGRMGDLAILERAARRVLSGSPPKSALVLIEGEAGVGKTRLLDELLSRTRPPRLGRARCIALERDLAFAPLAEVLRRLSPEALGDGERFPGLGEIVPELGTGVRAPSPVTRTQAFESLVRLIVARAPVALVFDDLQWADASSLSALAYLLRRTAQASVLIVGTFRSEEVDVDHPLRQLDAIVRMELQPLTSGEVAPLGVPGLHDKTGGNALLIVEYVRALADGEEMPAGLRDAILARSRSAGPAAHRLLAVASILGRSFDPAVLARIADVSPADTVELLEVLCARRLLTADGERFDFKHDLVREVLWLSLSPARRRHLHGRALEVLEAAGADPGELAQHAEEAGASERALRYSLTAGDAARARWANVESVAHYERALRVSSAEPELLEPAARESLDLRIARALTQIGRPVEAEAAIARARSSAEARGDDRGLFEALEALGIARQRGASAPSDALAVGETALEVARRIGEPEILSRAHTLVGSPAGSIGKLDLALEQCHAAIAEAERAGQAPRAYPIGRVGFMLHHRGREQEAKEWLDRAEIAAVEQQDEETLLMTRWVRALAFAARAHYREAFRELDSIAEIGRGEETFWHARVPNTYGALFGDLCQYQRALERDLESLEMARRSSARPVREVEMQTLLNLAADRIGLGRLKEARNDIETVRRQIADVEYARFRYVARMHYLDGELAIAEGDGQRAQVAADSCLTVARQYGLPKYEIRGRLAMGGALILTSDLVGARRHARAAARLADEGGFLPLSWRAWWGAYRAGGGAEDRRRAEKAVAEVANRLEEPLRNDFLRSVPVRS